MFKAGDPLPPTVLTSIAQGQPLEAIRQLRQAHGLGLKQAKDIIDAHVQGHKAAPHQQATGFSPPTATGSIPDTVVQAVAQGNKIEAIRLLRGHAGIGLKEAKDRVDALDLSRQRDAEGLSPGEVSRKVSPMTWVAVLAIVAAVACAYFRAGV